MIMCLSVTKWVHFSLGDAGVQKLFRRISRRLKPGGLLILEPQEWRSYRKKQFLTPEIRQTVRGIEMRPEARGSDPGLSLFRTTTGGFPASGRGDVESVVELGVYTEIVNDVLCRAVSCVAELRRIWPEVRF